MKRLPIWRTILATTAVTLVLAVAGCESPTEPDLLSADGLGLDALANHGSGMVEKPFKARLYTDLAGLAPDPSCKPDRLLNTQVGEGVATHLGRFSIIITFCLDPTDLLDDGLLTEGESVPYEDGHGTLVAANGDELYVEVAGTVLPSPDPDFDFEFHDVFHFVGGTGQLAGAAGQAQTHSFVDQASNRTLHRWQGSIVLTPGMP